MASEQKTFVVTFLQRAGHHCTVGLMTSQSPFAYFICCQHHKQATTFLSAFETLLNLPHSTYSSNITEKGLQCQLFSVPCKLYGRHTTDCIVHFKLSEGPLLTKYWLPPLLDIYCQGNLAFCWKFLASMALISVSIWCV